MKGTVYTETLIHSAPEAFVSEAPYQLIIVTLENGKRVTGRVSGDPISIDDTVILADERNGVPFFRKIS
jgi:uncharacterized OB-fold protein